MTQDRPQDRRNVPPRETERGDFKKEASPKIEEDEAIPRQQGPQKNPNPNQKRDAKKVDPKRNQ